MKVGILYVDGGNPQIWQYRGLWCFQLEIMGLLTVVETFRICLLKASFLGTKCVIVPHFDLSLQDRCTWCVGSVPGGIPFSLHCGSTICSPLSQICICQNEAKWGDHLEGSWVTGGRISRRTDTCDWGSHFVGYECCEPFKWFGIISFAATKSCTSQLPLLVVFLLPLATTMVFGNFDCSRSGVPGLPGLWSFILYYIYKCICLASVWAVVDIEGKTSAVHQVVLVSVSLLVTCSTKFSIGSIHLHYCLSWCTLWILVSMFNGVAPRF